MADSIDLNADLGESFGAWKMGSDNELLDIVTSANVACGFHAGDPLVMTETVRSCLAKGVNIGAHPGFDDLSGFGRRRMENPDHEMTAASIIYQIGAIQAVARSQSANVTHVKIHGALANMASESDELAAVCLNAVASIDANLAIVAMASTALQSQAEQLRLPVLREVFADRAYNDDGTLVSRGTAGAVIHDANEAATRVLKMLDNQQIESVSGATIKVIPDTICVHGDNPEAVRMAETLRARIEKAGISVTGYAVLS